MRTKKTFWRVEAKATASEAAKQYIRMCGAECLAFAPTAIGALRIVARNSGYKQSEFVVIGK